MGLQFASPFIFVIISVILLLSVVSNHLFNINEATVDAALQYKLTEKQKQGMLDMFNLARRQAKPQAADLPLLVWDDKLAQYASAYVQQCDKFYTYPRWSDAMIMYRDRGLDPVDIAHYRSVRQGPWFDYNTGGCRNGTETKCAHPELYARIVNNKVRKVGCEIYPCEVQKRYHHVCVMDYMGELRAGSYWTIGTPCSKCPSDLPNCTNKLCTK